MIDLRDVWRTFRMGDQDVHALAGVDERVAAGEHVAIMGPSGSGKSTLLNVVGLLDRPTRGSYRLDGREVAHLGEDELAALRRDAIGYVFQSYHLVPRLDATANVELPLVLAGLAPSERRTRVAAALEAVGLSHRARHHPSELSGGERQRTAIARATVLRPRVLLADEPTGNLDRHAGDTVLDLLDRLHAEGLTLLVVTHDPLVARRAERVLVLQDGRIVRRLPGHDLVTLAQALGHPDEDGPAAGGGAAGVPP